MDLKEPTSTTLFQHSKGIAYYFTTLLDSIQSGVIELTDTVSKCRKAINLQ